MVVAGQIEFLSCRAHSAWLIGKLELVDTVDLITQANTSSTVYTATRARQVKYESSPVNDNDNARGVPRSSMCSSGSEANRTSKVRRASNSEN